MIINDHIDLWNWHSLNNKERRWKENREKESRRMYLVYESMEACVMCVY